MMSWGSHHIMQKELSLPHKVMFLKLGISGEIINVIHLDWKLKGNN